MRTISSTSALIALGLTLPALAVFVGLPAHSAILRVLNDAAHGPIFAVFAVAVALSLQRLTRWPVQSQYLGAFVIASLAGGLVELLQPAFGRDGELSDVWTDALGAAAGLGGLGMATSLRRWIPAAILGLAIAAICWPVVEATLAYNERSRQAPALLELTGPADWYFLWTRGVEASEANLPEPWKRPGDPVSLRVRITAESSRTIGQVEPIADWQGYRRLMVDLTNPGPGPLRLTLRVHDDMHNNDSVDRFNRSFVLQAATRSVLTIPTTEIARAPHGRALDLSHVAAWIIFARDEPALAGQEFYVTRIWLE